MVTFQNWWSICVLFYLNGERTEGRCNCIFRIDGRHNCFLKRMVCWYCWLNSNCYFPWIQLSASRDLIMIDRIPWIPHSSEIFDWSLRTCVIVNYWMSENSFIEIGPKSCTVLSWYRVHSMSCTHLYFGRKKGKICGFVFWISVMHTTLRPVAKAAFRFVDFPPIL